MVYNEKVMEIFKNPKNVGKLKGANAIGQVGNVACGDIMKIYLKINENEIIEDASFETFGCAAAIVSSSIATELIKGWTVQQALEFDNELIIKEVGELPVHKIHCSVLAKEAIEDAITKYRKKQAKQPKTEKPKTTKVVKTQVEEVKKEVTQQEKDLKSTLSALKMAKIENKLAKTTTDNKKETLIKEEVFDFDKSQKQQTKENKKEVKEKKNNAKKLDKNFLNLTKKINKL